MATADPLFQLVRLISATDIQLSARSECGRRQLLAFVTGSSHLTLYYLQCPGQLPVLKIVPWFLETTKRIAALTFDPSGAWLLVAGHDGTLYIIPALSLVDPAAVSDHRWSTTDITTFTTNLCSPTSSAPTSVASGSNLGSGNRPVNLSYQQNIRISRPTCLAWWQCVTECQHVAVVGTDRGDILFVSLTGGTQVGLTYVKSHVGAIQICQDNSLDNVFLLITNEQRNQWKLLLEQRTTGYIWPLDNVQSKNSELTGSHGSLDLDYGSRNGAVLPTARSRLQGLKQLSVEKLASLKQRLADTRSKGVKERDTRGRRGSSGSSSDETQSRARKMSFSSDGPDWCSTGPIPDRLSPHVGETFLQPQYARGRYLLSGFYAPNNILTIHGMSLEVVPLFIYRLAPQTCDVLVTDRFLYVTDEGRKRLTVVSCPFAEGRLDGDSDHNPDSIIATFPFSDNERVLSVYKRTDSAVRPSPGSSGGSRRSKSGDRSESRSRSSRERDVKKSTQFSLPKDVGDLDVEERPVDTCVVVTTAGVYQVVLRRPAVELFMDLVLKRQELEEAERLAQLFGLDLQRLLELAGDLMLAGRHFPQSIALYKLSRCRHLKSVLKFAAAGYSKELLSYVTMLFHTASGELSASERIHLANLAVMAFTDQLLKAVKNAKKALSKQFLQFLRCNLHYDEVLAVNVAGQTGLWEVLQFLASQRSLHLEVLDILTKILRSLIDGIKDKDSVMDKTSPALDPGLWLCVSTPSLLQSLLAKPQLARTHLSFVSYCLPHLDAHVLERLASLLDPTSPVARPAMRKVLSARRRRQYSVMSTDSDSCEYTESGGAEEFVGSPVEEMLQLFLLVLLYLGRRRTPTPDFDRSLMDRIQLGGGEEEEPELPLCFVPLQTSLIGAGFCHTALVRNATIFTWGNAVQGCLGTGPTMSRYSCPQHVSTFQSLKVEVFSVSCGRQHTLALTGNGVYSWGSNQFGQLGVGPIGQSSWPVLVQTLARERVVAISAGQYHSLALTGDGRVYSWGWGVHGQLGHRSIEDCNTPKLIQALATRGVKQISAGHGHSLVLTTEGEVFSFGSSIFGQLGRGTNTKSTLPVRVEGIDEPVVNVNTNYFHNLAVTTSNRLFIWGASPQVLRLQAQAQKKARLMQMHCAQTPTFESARPVAPETVPAPEPEPENPNLQMMRSSDLSVDLDSPVLDLGPNDIAELFNDNAKTDNDQTDRNVEQNAINEDIAASKTLTKKSFTQSVHDYFAEQKTETNDLASSHNRNDRSPDNRNARDVPSLSDNSVKCDSLPKPDSRDSDSVKVASCEREREGNSIPSIVISPTSPAVVVSVEPVKKPTHTISRALKKPPAFLLDDGVQTHLSPQLVDTRLVEGQISQIACGCHHSALITKEGLLHLWGRNLDGQLGTGSRKEVLLPTPVFSHSNGGGYAKGGIANVIPVACELRRVQEVACGCEYTVVLDGQSSKLWAWGSNSLAQLGKAPMDDTKAIDGKLVVIKTVKRVIKLPHGSQNSCDSPREVPNIPASNITFRRSPPDPTPDPSVPLSSVETPAYGPRTLHHALERYHGHYDSAALVARCTELEDYQAAAKVALLDRNYHLALTHQLTALVVTGRRAKGGEIEDRHREEEKTKNEEQKTKNEEQKTKNEEQEMKNEEQEMKNEEVSKKELSVDDDLSTEGKFSSLMVDNKVDKPKNVEERQGDNVSEVVSSPIDDTRAEAKVSSLTDQESGEDKPKNVEERLGEDVINVLSSAEGVTREEGTENGADDNTYTEDRKNGEDKPNNVEERLGEGVINVLSSAEGVTREEKAENGAEDNTNTEDCKNDEEKTKNVEERQNEGVSEVLLSSEGDTREVSSLTVQESGERIAQQPQGEYEATPPDSVVSTPSPSEIHAFAIQGGNEEMSEGRQELSSPSDTVSPGSQELDYDEAGGETLGAGGGTTPATRPNELKLSNTLTSVMAASKEQTELSSTSAATSQSSESTADTPSDPGLTVSPLNPPTSSRPGPGFDAAPPSDPSLAVSLEVSPLNPPTSSRPGPEFDAETVTRAAEIVEHYISEMEDDSHSMMSRMLQQGLDFWLSHSLPVEQLESLLLKHMTKFFYPLGLLLFNKTSSQEGEEPDTMLNRLSTRFCLQLCSTLLAHINQRKPHPEYVELLANVTSLQLSPSPGVNGSRVGHQSSSRPEQLMETILARLGGATTLPYINIQEQAIASCLADKTAPSRLYAFSCGHHYSSSDVHQSSLPEVERSLPHTGRVLKTLFEESPQGGRLACPQCVLAHVASLSAP